MKKGVLFATVLLISVSLLTLLLIPLVNLLGKDADERTAGSSADSVTATFGPTITPTLCPQATPEPLWVDPLQSPTDGITQTVVIYIGNGEWAGVVMETGVYTQTGDFGALNNPAMIPVDLNPGQEHHLEVSGRVKVVEHSGCRYGGYTLTTTLDREGQPLTIIQSGGTEYLPIISQEDE